MNEEAPGVLTEVNRIARAEVKSVRIRERGIPDGRGKRKSREAAQTGRRKAGATAESVTVHKHDLKLESWAMLGIRPNVVFVNRKACVPSSTPILRNLARHDSHESPLRASEAQDYTSFIALTERQSSCSHRGPFKVVSMSSSALIFWV